MSDPARGGRASEEEAMVNFIKGFGEAEAVGAFLKSQLAVPPTMHEKFGVLSRTLTTRSKQFSDLPDLKSQLAYFHDVLTESSAFPSSWVIFASNTGYMFKHAGGRFIEDTGSIFQDEKQLGQFCSIRAKYTMLGIKNLILMRCLKCTSQTQSCVVQLATALEMGCTPGNTDENIFESLTAGLAAVDGDLWRRRVDGLVVVIRKVPAHATTGSLSGKTLLDYVRLLNLGNLIKELKGRKENVGFG